MRFYLFTYLLLCLAGCWESKSNPKNNKIDSTPGNNINTSIPKRVRNILWDPPAFDKAHPNAKLLMNDSFYFNLTDETAPFGNTDGANIYAGFKEWRQTHKNKDPREYLFEQINYLGYPKFDINETDLLKLKSYLQERELGSRFMSGTDAAIVAIAFGQLYLEGSIDEDYKELAKTAVNRQLIPELLECWGAPYKEERKSKLKKMLAILNK